MGSFSIWHWGIVLAIVLLVFGTRKLRNAGADLGDAVRGFKQGMAGESSKPAAADDETLPLGYKGELGVTVAKTENAGTR